MDKQRALEHYTALAEQAKSSGAVDVIAVLDSLIEFHDTTDSLKGRNCIAVRAAVAELIEGAKRAQHILALHDDQCPQLDAALANVGPQS